MKKLIYFLCSLITLLVFANIGFADKQAPNDSALTVGHIYFPPFFSSNDTGLEADIIKQVAKEAGIKEIEFTTYPDLPHLFAALEAGDIDIIANGVVSTPARTERFTLTNPYYVKGGIGFLYKNDNQHNFKEVNDINDSKVGTLTGSYPVAWMQEKRLQSTVQTYKTLPELLKALRAGNIDVMVTNYSVCRHLQSEDPTLKAVLVQPMPIVFAVKKNNVLLQQKLNTGISNMEADHTLYNIKAKHLKKIGIQPKEI